MIVPEEGEVLKHRVTGNLFEVKKVTHHYVILGAIDGLTQIMTGEKSLASLFEKVTQGSRVGNFANHVV